MPAGWGDGGSTRCVALEGECEGLGTVSGEFSLQGAMSGSDVMRVLHQLAQELKGGVVGVGADVAGVVVRIRRLHAARVKAPGPPHLLVCSTSGREAGGGQCHTEAT